MRRQPKILIQKAYARTLRNVQKESDSRAVVTAPFMRVADAVVTAPFESGGRGRNRALGQVKPKTMKENRTSFVFLCSGGPWGNRHTYVQQYMYLSWGRGGQGDLFGNYV